MAASSRVGRVVGSVLIVLAGCTQTDDAPDGSAPAPSTTETPPGLKTTADRMGPVMPMPETVGLPRGVELDDLDPDDVEHGRTYRSVRVTGDLDLGPGERIRFEECLIEGSIVTRAPLELVRCDIVEGGLYPYDVGGHLEEVLIDSPNGQAFRPSLSEGGGFDRSTPWTVEDTYLRVPPGPDGAHVESVQILGGRDFVFRNVVFDTGCPFNGTQTADLSMNAADSLVEDSWFVGCGGFAIYSDGPGVSFVRPRFGDEHRWGVLYTDAEADRIDPEIIDPMDLEGRPLDR